MSGAVPGLAGALAGLRVLDASRVLAGPFAAQVLADLGADVVKVEAHGEGDETRAWGPPFAADGTSAYFMAANRGKRSIALDLKSPEERATFLKLTAKADVVIENFREASLKALKLTAMELHAVNPRLVIVSISGYGRGGAGPEKPGYDFVIQGLSGMMAATGPVDGVPSKFGVAIADLATAHYAVIAVLAALRAREASGHGYAVDLALIDCAVATMANVAQAFLVSKKPPTRQGNAHLQIAPYQTFQAADGHVIVAVGNDAQFRKLAQAAGQPAWADDARFKTNALRVQNRVELEAAIAPLIAKRSVGAWVQVLETAGVPCGPVQGLDQLFASDLAAARGLTLKATRPDGSTVDLVASPLVKGTRPKAPPSLGADADAVLRDWLGPAR